MHWTEEKDLLMMREMAAKGVFNHRSGSRERGQVWQNIATSLNAYEEFLVTARAVRDRFTTLMKKYQAQTNADLKRSGIGGDELSEYEILIEDLISQSNDADIKHETEVANKKRNLDEEQQKAVSVRETAMERLGDTRKRNGSSGSSEDEFPRPTKSRRSSSDTMIFLKEKIATDKEMQQQRAQERKEELELQRQQVNQNSDMVKLFHETIQQQNNQQTAVQQHLGTLIGQQQQQFNLILQMLQQNKQ